VNDRRKARTARRQWCGGHSGREHDLAVILPENRSGWQPCGWYLTASRPGMPDENVYRCRHAYGCKRCGKLLRYIIQVPETCPGFTPRGNAK
jgi:hypothetical protein